MVNAKAAPALPWGASAEENHDDRSNVNSESQRSLDASTTAPDHSDRPQAQVTMPSAGSIIEVHLINHTAQGDTAHLLCFILL